MDTDIPKQEFSIRKLGTKSVTLYPTKAQIIRNINGISLKPGPNQITIIGLTPTCDEHSIKVDGTGAATITDLTVELVPNPEVYADIYPDEDEDEDDDKSDASDTSDSDASDSETEPETGRSKAITEEIVKLSKENQALVETLVSANSRVAMIEGYLKVQTSRKEGINLSEVLAGYREERAKIFVETTAANDRSAEITRDIARLRKEARRLNRDARKAKEKVEKEKAKIKEKAAKEKAKAKEKEARKKREKREAKERIHKERAKFWPKKVFKVTVSLEAPSGFTPASSRRGSIDSLVKVPEAPKGNPDVSVDLGSAEINLSLSYITYSASWSPRYDLSLNTVTNTGALDYSAELVNVTSETWKDARIILSTSQSSYAGLTDTIPTLQPWHIRLAKGFHGGENAALQAGYEAAQAIKNRFDVPPQVYQPRNELFGLDDPLYYHNNAYRTKHGKAAPQQARMMNSAYNAYSPPAQQMQQAAFYSAAPAAPGALQSNMTSYPPPPAPKKSMAKAAFGGSSAVRRSAAGALSPHAEDAEGGYGDFDESEEDSAMDDVTLGGIAEQALAFEESSFEESGLTTTYDLPSLKTLAPTSTATKHKIARVDFKGIVFSHIVIPKLRAAAFLKARLRNASKITLLKGSAGLTLDGSFLGQSILPRCTAGDAFTLNLGVDPGVTVGYARPSVQRSSSGLFTKEDCEVFTRVATITNTKPNAVVELTLLEQVPVSEDERLKIEIITPRGLRIGGEAVAAGVPKEGDKAKEAGGTIGKGSVAAARASVYADEGVRRDGRWGSAVASAKKGGEISYTVKINPGRGCKIILEYEATYPGGETVVAV